MAGHRGGRPSPAVPALGATRADGAAEAARLAALMGRSPAPAKRRPPALHTQFEEDLDRRAPLEAALLARRVAPAEVDGQKLCEALELDEAWQGLAREDALGTVSGVLSTEACAKLRHFADSALRIHTLDSVDGLPEYQVELAEKDLLGLVGEAAVGRLRALPYALADFSGAEHNAGPAPRRWAGPMHAFVRKYGPGLRPHLGFHTDCAAATANVALCRPDTHVGGELLVVHAQAVRAVGRAE
eukprot:EG_transcript_19561